MPGKTRSREQGAGSREHFNFVPRGNVILLAVFMLATGIVGGLTIALIVVGQLRQARSLDNSLAAYYSAEAGLEQSLYDVRQSGLCANAASCNDAAYVPQTLPGSNTTACSGTPSAVGCTAQSYDRQILPPTNIPAPSLPENETFQLDLDPSNPVSQLQVVWSPASATPPLLEVSYLVSVTGTTQVCRPNAPTLYAPYGCPNPNSHNGVCYPNDSSPLTLTLSAKVGNELDANDCPSGAVFQQVRFKALVAGITNLIIEAQGGSLNNYIEVHSRRRYSTSTQALQTTIPKSVPAFGFPDYVIFSEQDISK